MFLTSGAFSKNLRNDLDPLVSKFNDPPTEAQVELAIKLGINLEGKNPGSASLALSKALRDLAADLVKKHKLVPGTTCVYDEKVPSVIKKVGDAPSLSDGKGSIILITLTQSGRSMGKWVHPRWLSGFTLPKKPKRKSS